MPLTPEEIVFRTNSDSKSIILITDDKVIYATEGIYGGFILKPKQLGLESFENFDTSVLTRKSRAFYVVPEAVTGSEVPKEYEDIVSRYLNALPEKVRKEFEKSRDVEIVIYKYVEVEIDVKSVTSRYIILDFTPKPRGLKLTAKALRLIIHYEGSRKHPKSTIASSIVKNWKLEFPENEVLQKYVYAENYTGYRGRGSTIYLKIVLEAPKELATPTPVKVAEEKAVAIRGFLVVSRLPSKALLDHHLPEIFKNVRIGEKQIRLCLGYFYNRLGVLSRKFYNNILRDYAVDAGFGYIIPKENVPAFLAEIDRLKREYEEYEKQLKDFLLHGKVPPEVEENKRAKIYREYLTLIKEYLAKYKVDVAKKAENLRIADRVYIRLIPFSIDMGILEEYVDEKVKKRIERELYEARREVVNSMKAQIEGKLRAIVMKLEKYAKRELTEEMLGYLKREFDEVVKVAEEFGIETPLLYHVRNIVESPETLVEELKKIKIEGVSGRLKALLEELK